MTHTELVLTQPDWTRFLTPEGLAEKAGTKVAPKRLDPAARQFHLGAHGVPLGECRFIHVRGA
jgi:hypothetical protein